MRSHNRPLLGAVLAISFLVLTAPSALSQCAPAQVFGSTGLAMLGMVQVEIEGAVSGNEIGRFWNAGNSAFANNFAGDCPASNWLVQRNSGDRGVIGAISGTGCIASSCPGPDDEMIWLIEDYGPTGPPGVLDTAHFVGFRMDATPAAARYWDLARAAGNVPVTLPLLPFPEITVTSIQQGPGVLTITFDLDDAGLNFWGENAGGPLPDTASIVSYDICSVTGYFPISDPGRSRADWNCDVSIPYTGGPSVGNLGAFSCAIDGEIFMAVGMTFSGGDGEEIQSELVGKAWGRDCNILADPDSVPEIQERPHFQPKPRRTR